MQSGGKPRPPISISSPSPWPLGRCLYACTQRELIDGVLIIVGEGASRRCHVWLFYSTGTTVSFREARVGSGWYGGLLFGRSVGVGEPFCSRSSR